MDDWETTFAGLRRSILDKTRVLADEAAAALDRMAEDATSRPALDALARVFHTLSGSAGSYGFAQISEAAAAGESTCRKHVEAATVPSAAELKDWRILVDWIRSEAATALSQMDVVAPDNGPATSTTPATS